MRPKAVFDIGTNSVKLLVALPSKGSMEVLADEMRICALGEGLHASGRLGEAAMERTLSALEELAGIARRWNAGDWTGVGTEALRRASNGAEFLERLQSRTGIELRVISGEEEARLSFLAAVSSLGFPPGDIAAIDVGGGSTEFTFGARGAVLERFSMPVGCIACTDRYLHRDPPTHEELAALMDGLDESFRSITGKADTLVGIGGTATTLGTVMLGMESFDAERLRGLELPVEELDRQIELYRSRTLAERRGIKGLHPDRAPVILAGAAIIRSVMRRLGPCRFILSDRALRHGLFHELWLS